METIWLPDDPVVTQAYGCTEFAEEGPNPFHSECGAFHDGIDLGINCGTPVFSGVNGVVVQKGVYGGGPNALILQSGDWWFWLLHLQAAYVNVGDGVFVGQRIADVGTLGFSTGCHLHFEVTPAGGGYRSSVDPAPWLVGSPPLAVAPPWLASQPYPFVPLSQPRLWRVAQAR